MFQNVQDEAGYVMMWEGIASSDPDLSDAEVSAEALARWRQATDKVRASYINSALLTSTKQLTSTISQATDTDSAILTSTKQPASESSEDSAILTTTEQPASPAASEPEQPASKLSWRQRLKNKFRRRKGAAGKDAQ